ncbi:MAG: arsenite efflux transporter metallochaperone ArsD [Moritella sp.]|uniref:arsenite efflux transporter metallochaperone ArsD n=1 Tax=Moritella sp. TaxID=78556 RepID=UPI0029BC522D|nr:arsenite efflux transporter metallochaperone ArsD [Moritella sp.]MDX2320067.1 arsenite efflux transporter metallochaperone ArsD [Moritella sp.]
MTVLTVFEPAMCCSSGICGADVDPVLVQFSADIDYLKRNGVNVERFNLANNPLAFVHNPIASDFLKQFGDNNLPLILKDNVQISSHSYPSRTELELWFDMSIESPQSQPNTQCKKC